MIVVPTDGTRAPRKPSASMVAVPTWIRNNRRRMNYNDHARGYMDVDVQGFINAASGALESAQKLVTLIGESFKMTTPQIEATEDANASGVSKSTILSATTSACVPTCDSSGGSVPASQLSSHPPASGSPCTSCCPPFVSRSVRSCLGFLRWRISSSSRSQKPAGQHGSYYRMPKSSLPPDSNPDIPLPMDEPMEIKASEMRMRKASYGITTVH